MAWCFQATSYYLRQCWPRFSTLCVTKPQYDNMSSFHGIAWFLEAYWYISINAIIPIDTVQSLIPMSGCISAMLGSYWLVGKLHHILVIVIKCSLINSVGHTLCSNMLYQNNAPTRCPLAAIEMALESLNIELNGKYDDPGHRPYSRQVTVARCRGVAARQSWAEYSSRPTAVAEQRWLRWIQCLIKMGSSVNFQFHFQERIAHRPIYTTHDLCHILMFIIGTSMRFNHTSSTNPFFRHSRSLLTSSSDCASAQWRFILCISEIWSPNFNKCWGMLVSIGGGSHWPITIQHVRVQSGVIEPCQTR